MTHSADFLRAVHHNLCDMAGEMVRAEMRLARGGGREPETFVKWEDMTHEQRVAYAEANPPPQSWFEEDFTGVAGPNAEKLGWGKPRDK
jgi:hypothetical protein